MGAIAAVASMGAKVVIHKDWVVVIASDVPDRLTQLNSNMRRIDLSCSILAPLFVGLMSSLGTAPIAVAVVAAWSFVSLFIEYKLVGWVYDHIPALHNKVAQRLAAGLPVQGTEVDVQSLSDRSRPLDRVALASLALVEKVRVFVKRFIGTMREYRAHPVFFASLAYCILYVSVLSMGGIMASWLKLKNVSNAVIAVVRGLAALVGVGSTFCVPFMAKRWGVVQAGLIAIWLQVIMLLPVAFSFVYYFASTSAAHTHNNHGWT
jgi:iron-regulated transporter 1